MSGRLGVWVLTALLSFTPMAWSADLSLQSAIVGVGEKVLPTLVNIQPVTETYRGGEKRRSTSIGSGVIISPDGYVLTNYHIAAKAKKVLCTLSSGERIHAELIGSDPATDIAVVKLNMKEFKGHTITWARMGDSDQVRMGQYVLAFGSPLALSRSMSLGIVSNPKRYLPGGVRLPTGERTGSLNLWIQTDAAINPGNSGGPLVNLAGEVIGINSRGTYAENIGFAIPINTIKEVLDTVIARGKIERSYLGLTIQPMEGFAGSFGEGQEGVLVGHVVPDSPAFRAGLAPGDVILEFDEQPISARFVEDLPAVLKTLSNTTVGKKVKVVFRRQDKEGCVYLTTETRPREIGEDFECAAWGFTIKGITHQMARDQNLQDSAGVLVTGVKRTSPAGRSNMLINGDVVKFIAGRAVTDLDSFRGIYEELRTKQASPILLKVKRGKDTAFVLLKIDYTKEQSEEITTPEPEESAGSPMS